MYKLVVLIRIFFKYISLIYILLHIQNGFAEEIISKPYLETKELLFNPDRGFYHQIGGRNVEPSPSQLYKSTLSVFRVYYGLNKFENSPISERSLKNLEKMLIKAAEIGVTIIPSFYYTWGYEKGNPFKSPKEEIILNHINQISPILNKHKNAISFLEVGFIGAWGEWHSDQYGDKKKFKSFRKQLVESLLNNLDDDIYLALRYPSDRNNLSKLIAVSERVGLHHDCPNYYNDIYPRSNAQDITISLPQGGEVCQLDPRSDFGSKSSNRDKYYGCEVMMKYFDKFNFDVLNVSDWSRSNSRFLEQGCYDEIRDRLGYRYLIKESSYSNGILKFEIHNIGFGKSFKNRWIKIKIGEKMIDTNLNPKNWLSGQSYMESVNIGITDLDSVELLIEGDIRLANVTGNKIFLKSP